MRWNTGFETSGLAFVIAFDHLPHFMQPRDDACPIVRHGQLDEIADGPQTGAQLLQQRRNSLTVAGGDGDTVRMLFLKTREHIPVAIKLVDFIEDHQGRFAFRADLF